MIERKTQFSECRRYRFVLWREWGVGTLPLISLGDRKKAHEFVQFIGLNPSTANETTDDMTIRKCIGFAKRWGYGAICMTNLFTFVSTDPRALNNITDLQRGCDLLWVETFADSASLVVAAWGGDGNQFEQSRSVISRLRKMGKPIHCLGKTRDGVPRHPSRIGYSTKLEVL